MVRSPFYIALWIALVFGAVVAAVLPIKALIYHSPDDAFFYLKTAWNFAAGLGSTFDGLNSTNGYHPLWFLILAGMYFLGEVFGIAAPDGMYRVAFGLQWVMFIGTVYFAVRAFTVSAAARRSEYRPAISDRETPDVTSQAMLFGLVVFFLIFIRVVGSEAQVSVLILAGYLFVKEREWQRGIPQFMTKAVLMALLFLSRIDYVSTIIPALFFGDVLTAPKGDRIRTALFLAVVTGGTAVTYFAINVMEFGHLLTVSASWKSEFPRFLLFSNIPMYIHGNPVQFARAVVAIAICIWFVIRVLRKREEAAPMDVLLAWLAAGSVLFLLQTMSFNAHKIREWYTSLPMFIAILLAWRMLNAQRRAPAWITAPLAAAGAAFLMFAGMATAKWDANYDFAHTLKERLGTTNPVLVVDCAGIVGYFSGAPVVNGDGLVNSFDYLDAVRRGELRQWLAAWGVPYYATYTAVPEPELQHRYRDRSVTGLGGMDFVFEPSQIVMRAPFRIDNIRFHSTGEWIVFAFDRQTQEGMSQ